MKKKILAIGEIIWDVYPDKQVIGGAPLNFVAHASLCGVDSTLISAVGNDSLGADAIRALTGFGVNCKYIQSVPQQTGQCLVTLDNNAIPQYTVLPNAAYDHMILSTDDLSAIRREKYDAFYFGTLIQRGSVSRRTVHRIAENCTFGETVCDVNLRPECYDADSVMFCLTHATVLKVSMEEEPFLRASAGYTPQDSTPASVARAICSSFPNIGIVLVTLGADGSFAYDNRTQKEYRQPAMGDRVVSTVGAGDSFLAAWLTEYLNGASMELCLQKAAERSGFVVAHAEAIPLY